MRYSIASPDRSKISGWLNLDTVQKHKLMQCSLHVLEFGIFSFHKLSFVHFLWITTIISEVEANNRVVVMDIVTVPTLPKNIIMMVK